MGGGCLVALGRVLTLAFLRLGAILASILIRTFTFLLLNVIGPLCLGMTREVIQRMIVAWHGGRRRNSGAMVRSRISYALAGGMLWVMGYVVLRTVLRLLSWMGRLLFSHLAPIVPTWSHVFIVAGLIFMAGAVLGALAYGYEEEVLSEW